MAKARKSQIVENWIGLVRTRLAAHRREKPTTKAAQIRALWPEVEAALHGGHSTKKICAWLEEEAGITVGISSLTSYISVFAAAESRIASKHRRWTPFSLKAQRRFCRRCRRIDPSRLPSKQGRY